MLFKIRYTEIYSSVYVVEADDEEAAKQLLLEDIRSGREDGPEECIGSEVAVISQE